MPPKADRLSSSRDFRFVYQKGKSVANRYLVLYALKKQSGGSRIGLAVSRKVLRSVDRNRVKRLLREAWRQAAPTPAKLSHNIVIVGREALLREKSQAATAALTDLLEKAGLKRGKD